MKSSNIALLSNIQHDDETSVCSDVQIFKYLAITSALFSGGSHLLQGLM